MNRLIPDPAIEVHDLTVSYDRRPVLWDVDLTLPKGSLVGIIGPNGAGKSTLIKSVMGLLPVSSGYAKIFGKDLSEIRDKVSYVPQRESVDWDFPASALDVVLMGRYGRRGFFGGLRKADKDAAEEALAKVNMLPYRDRQIAQLSGGQQQRVFLARALAQNAELYLMDEPFAGVDMATEAAIIELLRDMRAQGKTVAVVHHDLQSASAYFDWIVLLNMRLVASGPTREVLTQEFLQETYGGKLDMLAHVGNLLKQQQFPARES